MQLNSDKIKFIIGSAETAEQMEKIPVLQVFDPISMNYLDSVSKFILSEPEARQYPDVITFGFWCRKASILNLRMQYENELGRIGKGVVFHIAPANVAVNYAYSFTAGLLSGNANIVRLPSKDFEQVRIINNAFRNALSDEIKPYICFIQYGHEREITDYFSALCDMRVIWGGDQTIMSIRESPLKPRANEITFADRYSICIIDADKYLQTDDKSSITTGFYNDTYLTDQNACTSPRLVIWSGNQVEEAKNIFWNELQAVVQDKYTLQPVKAVSKYNSLCRLAALEGKVHLESDQNNYVVRVQVDSLNENMMNYCGNCGSFLEYYAKNIEEILPVCSLRCQTISYYGVEKELFQNFLTKSKPRGIDRIVPIGRTMDFSLIWDGYDLITGMSRKSNIM